MPFACIYVPNFPVAAVLRAEPELHARAVAVLQGKPPLEKVFAVNEMAGGLGITSSMTKAQAELCTELALRPRSALQESNAHAALLDCAQSFSPRVEDSACDTALLDLAGLESLFGPLPTIAHSMIRRAADLGLVVNVAVAANADAALLAARGLSGVTVIPPGKEAEQLGPLPIEVMFADELTDIQKEKSEQLLATLDRWGVRNLRALAALPEVALSERLGQEGLRLQQLARGTASRTLVPLDPPIVFEEAIELEHSIVLLEPLAFLLNRLLEQLCNRLAVRALAAQELRLTLELDYRAGVSDEPDDLIENRGIPSESDAPLREENSGATTQNAQHQHFSSNGRSQFCRTLRLPLPMLDAKLFLKLLQLDLNAHPPGAPIIKVHLAAEPSRPRSAQGGLFRPPSPEPEKLELTLARIAGIVGENKVGSLELLDTYRPEGFRMRRFVAEEERKKSAAGQQHADQELNSHSLTDTGETKSAVTALRLFRPPLHVTVTLQEGQPAHVFSAKRKEVQGDVLWKAGPWRISGDWWEREAWARDEWDIALQNKNGVALYRLVHDLLGGGWFVEGTYD
jgi:protein ImuB